jgi:proteasome lid subunit RPN8/RPN11
LEILGGVLDAITDHARRDAPKECCGLLVGTVQRIDESVPMTNRAAGATRFQVDPGEHIALNRRLRGSGRQVVGVYHSHPRGPAEPSPVDVREAHYPEFVYVIVSLADSARPEVRAYRIRDAAVTEIQYACTRR